MKNENELRRKKMSDINCSVGVHSSCGSREEHGFLPLTTEVIEPPGVLVRTI